MRARKNNLWWVIVAVFPILLGSTCHKTGSGDIDLHATSAQVMANGTAMDTIYAGLPLSTPVANRLIFFQADAGLFANGFDTISVLANRTDIDPGHVAAVVSWHASLRSGADTITAFSTTAEATSSTLYLTLDAVGPDSMWLTTSSDSITNAFSSQTTITGILFSAFGGMVSLNTPIYFSDSLVGPTGNTAAGGRFMLTPAYSDTVSRVTTIYSLPSLSASGLIKITGSVAGAGGSKVPLAGSVEVYYTYTP